MSVASFVQKAVAGVTVALAPSGSQAEQPALPVPPPNHVQHWNPGKPPSVAPTSEQPMSLPPRPVDTKPATEVASPKTSQPELNPEVLRRAVFDYVHYKRETFRDAALGREAPKRPEALTDRVLAILEDKFRPLDTILQEQVRRASTITELAGILRELSGGPASLDSAKPIIGIAINTKKIGASMAAIRRDVYDGPSKAQIEKAETALGKLGELADANRQKSKELLATSSAMRKISDMYDASFTILSLCKVYESLFDAESPAKAAAVVSKFGANFMLLDTIHDRTIGEVGKTAEKERAGMLVMVEHMRTLSVVLPLMSDKANEAESTFAKLKTIGDGQYGKLAKPVEGTLTNRGGK